MSTVTPDTTVKAADHPVTTTVEGELVLLNTETGMYQGIDGVGPRIWELIQEATTIEAVVESLANEYDVDVEQCETEVVEFVEALAAEELVNTNVQSSQ